MLALNDLLAAAKSLSSAAHLTGSAVGSPYRSCQLTRLNLPVDDTNIAQEALANRSVVDSYDIIAAQPISERAFAFVCTTLNVDIISVDLSKRLAIKFKPEYVKTALKRGLFFEIQYSSALREASIRRQLFANAQALTQASRGRGIILTSGAHTVQDLRGTLDVINLGMFLGLSEHQARDSLSKNASAVVEHARQRKAYRGSILISSRDAESEVEMAMQIDE